MTVLLALFGGTALLLYGIRLSGDSMQRALGGRLRQMLTVMSRSRLNAVLSGALVTAMLQSSAATTLMLIGFVSAGLMAFRQTLGVILGADIGTTLTVQLIAFRVTDYALLLVGVGFLDHLHRAAEHPQGRRPGHPRPRARVPRPQAHPGRRPRR